MKRDFILTTLIGFTYVFSVDLIRPILAPYLNQSGYSNFYLLILFSLFPLAVILLSPFFGSLSDKIGRTSVIRIGIAIQIFSMTLYIYGFSSILIVGLARIFNAIAYMMVHIIVISKINDSITDKERGKLSGISFSIERLGYLISPVFGGYLADKFFIEFPFFISIILLSILLIFLFFNEKDKSIVIETKRTKSRIKEFLKIKKLKGMAILGISMHAFFPTYLIFLPIYILKTFNLGYSSVGLVYFVLSFPMLFQFMFGTLADKFPRKSILFFGTTLFGVMWMILPFQTNYLVLLSVLLLAGVGESAWNISALAIMSDVGEKNKKEGTIISTYTSIAKIGSFSSFLISSLLVNIISIQYLFVIIGVGILIANITAYQYLR